jgi:Ribonuclease G/E
MKRRKTSTKTTGDRSVQNARPQSLPENAGTRDSKAVADVTRDAGKSFVRGLANIFGAGFTVRIAENQAKGEAARRSIKTEERRRFELEEITHQGTKALAMHRYERLLVEMAREQANFEAITVRSLKQIELGPGDDKPREIDADWMFKFARYAQDVSDRGIQELWARI